MLILYGCQDGGKPQTPQETPIVYPDYPTNTPHYPLTTMEQKLLVDEYIKIIKKAGFPDYADLAADMQRKRKIIFVRPPGLTEEFNAWADIQTKEIWLNKPMFDRYPHIAHQTTIFFHELIHIKSTELTHFGPWWKDQDVFAMWCKKEYNL